MNPKWLVWLIYFSIVLKKCDSSKFHDTNLEMNRIHNYCRSFTNCNDCKSASPQCDWCHERGCTNQAAMHCPKKLFIDRILKKNLLPRFCNHITTKGPIFVPAFTRKSIKVNLKVDDMTLYERNIMCEIRLDDQIIQVAGIFKKGSVYCKEKVFKIHKSVHTGYLRLIWGGAQPFSNKVLLMVYNCRRLARNCADCQNLDKEFSCGWCEENGVCSVKEECPGKVGRWVNRTLACEQQIEAHRVQRTVHFYSRNQVMKVPRAPKLTYWLQHDD